MADIFIVLIILHTIGDYYLQTSHLAELKEYKYSFLLLHSLIYAAPSFLSILLFVNTDYITVVILFNLAHILIDTIKFFIKPKLFYPKKDKENHFLKVDLIYCFDQILHIITIIIISILFLQSNVELMLKPGILKSLNMEQEMYLLMIRTVAVFLIILKPVSITFYKLLNVELLAKSDSNSEDEAIGAGKLIGYMERIIMTILLILGEYTAMGFIIAGKTIVRIHGQVKQEFLIIGTFYGVITSLTVYIVFFVL